MDGERVSANHKKARASVKKGTEQVEKILVHEARSVAELSCVMRTGVSSRG